MTIEWAELRAESESEQLNRWHRECREELHRAQLRRRIAEAECEGKLLNLMAIKQAAYKAGVNLNE